MTEQNDDVVFAVTTGFGANTKRPYVQILIEAADYMTQMPPETARELALNLLSAAEAADGDGFLMGFLKDALEISDLETQAAVLMQFRNYRETERELDEKRKRRSLFPGRSEWDHRM
ncbi:MAG: hypothetical protein R2932_59115 [Caldilineaceae bacterium]